MLVAASPYHLPPSGTVVLSNVPPNLAPAHLVPILPAPAAINPGYHDQKKRYNQETEVLVQRALREAWEQYGPKAKHRGENLPPVPWLSEGQPPSQINPHSFQTLTSEWDQRVTKVPVRNRPILEPGVFNRVLSRYIELEVNHHEVADFIRRVVFWFGIAVLGLGWIFLGLAVGLIPFHIFGWSLGKRNLEGKVFTDSTKSDKSDGDAFNVRNDIMREITERVFLALDGDWLQRLEQKVKKGSNGRWLKTHVHCCIMPDAKAKGTAECQLIRKARKVSSPFKCLSDLIYDIQFGPADSNTSSLTSSNTTSTTTEKHFY